MAELTQHLKNKTGNGAYGSSSNTSIAAAELYIAYKRYLDSRGEESTAVKSRAQKILDRVSELKGM
jgi:hypothetical protein